MAGNAEIGKIGWIDISVDDASGLRDFYASVVGWIPEDVSMGEYSRQRIRRISTGFCNSQIVFRVELPIGSRCRFRLIFHNTRSG